MGKKDRIFLSPPHMSGLEDTYIKKAFTENYITTAGQNINTFEADLCAYTSSTHAIALNSGTAAIHLALRILGITTGDEVLCSSFTFVATANPILYQGAIPVFIDSEPETWNMCPVALEEAIKNRIRQGRKPKAILLVHLYGMPAKLKEIIGIAETYHIPLVEDAAEALGSTYEGKPLGTYGLLSIFSFNGNKIITTSGGGALLTNNATYARQALFLATQARDPAPYYQHSQAGYNYRLSNILAGVGIAQLQVLDERVQQRRAIHQYYADQLEMVSAITFLPESIHSFSNRWLSCMLLSPNQPVSPEIILKALEEENIEARRLWKPLHLQPLFADCPYYGKSVAENLFNQGICLPSGSAMTSDNLKRVVQVIKSILS